MSFATVIPHILSALSQGYNMSQILKNLVSKGGPLSKTLKRALSEGYSEDEIGEYLTKGKSKSYSQRQAMLSPQTEREKASRIFYRGEGIEGLSKGLGTAAAVGTGLYGASKLPGLLKGGMKRGGGPFTGTTINIPPTSPSGGAQQQSYNPGQTAQPSMQQTQPVQQTQQTPIQTPVIQPQQPPNVNSSQILQEMGLTEKISNLFKAGNNPEQIAAGIQLSLTPGGKNYLQNKLKSGEAKPLPEMVQDYLTEQQGQQRTEAAQKIDQVTPEQKTAISEKLTAGEKAKPLEKMVEATTKPQKGSVVATPDGMVGEIKDIKKNEALVESDGKLHKVKVDEIELPNEELIKAAEDLLKIPAVDKSAPISLTMYRPSTNELYVQFHNGQTYVYKDVPEEIAVGIQHALGEAKTTGENVYGAWEEGLQSRGGLLMKEIVHNPKYSKDQEGKTWEKLGTYYDYWNKLRKKPKRKKS